MKTALTIPVKVEIKKIKVKKEHEFSPVTGWLVYRLLYICGGWFFQLCRICWNKVSQWVQEELWNH